MSAFCASQRKQSSAVRNRVWGAAVAACAALAMAGCHQAGTGTTPSVPPSFPSSSSAVPAYTSPAPATQVPGPDAPGNIVPVHDPGQVTGTLTGPCHMTGTYPDQLPDQRCTPGSYDPAVTQANIHSTICVSGYTAKVRPPVSQTNAFKFNEAYPAYYLTVTVKTELDHLIALEIGGSNAAQNLWPEIPPSYNPKDAVEAALHSAVCSGKITLRAAQVAIAANWTTAEGVLGLK